MTRLLVLICLVLLAHGLAAAATRSEAARQQFARGHICPSTHKYRLPCPGYVIDHVKSLDCGGKDVPANMQYQTIAAGLAKDKWERNGPSCKHRTHGKKT